MALPYIYLSLLLTISIIFLSGWKMYGRAERVIGILIIATFVSECLSVYVMFQRRNNLLISHVYSPLEFMLISLYFNYGISYFRRWRIGIAIGCCGIAFSLLDTLFLENIRMLNSYFLLFEGIVIIIYCLLALHKLFLDEEQSPYRSVLFWIALCMMLFWTVTYTGWGIHSAFNWTENDAANRVFDYVLKVTGFAYYIGICMVFLRYKKLIPTARA